MTRLCDRVNALGALARKCLLAVVSSEGLYLGIMVLFYGILNTDVFMTRGHLITPLREYVIMPWSGAMLAFYLVREKHKCGLDIWALVLLTLWLIVPFVMRFGTEYFTIYSAVSFALCFFVFYASVSESEPVRRAHQLDAACACFGVISIVLGGALLYCAVTGKTYYSYWDTQYFGVVNGQLQNAMHYNVTGRMGLTCLLMCLVGLCRSEKKPPAAVFYLVGMIIMSLVVVLTQSRTARYAMLAAYALGTWNIFADRLPIQKWLLRQGVALICAALVLMGGYKLSIRITDAALAHYAGQPAVSLEAVIPSALAEDTQQEPAQENASKPIKARNQAVDSTFSDRTNIWKNIFKGWAENPWHMLIGHGPGRTKWMVAENTIHEHLGFAEEHNAYLRFAADHGMIAFGLLMVFALSIAPSALRVFFARGKKRMPGGCALCLVAFAILATGMMEIEPLNGMTVMCMTLFFVLGQISAAGRDMKGQK